MTTLPPDNIILIEEQGDSRSDHDLLICIEQKVKNIIVNQRTQDDRFNDHVKYHRQLTIAACAAVFTGITSLIVGVILVAVSVGIGA